MNTLPCIEIEYAGDDIDCIYITSTPEASQSALNDSSEHLNARDKLLTASTYVSDFLIYRSIHPEEAELQSVEAVKQATDNALDYLKDSRVNIDDLIAYADGSYLFQDREFDGWSMAAFVQTDTRKLINCIEDAVPDKQKTTHFLPMANSALPIALLSWETLSFGRNMTLHPILFSRSKMEHPEPQLSVAEFEYFRECAARGDNFVIFEEDTQSGDTVLNMMNFLVRHTGADFNQVCGVTPSYSQNGQHAVLRRGVEGLAATRF